MKKCKSCNKDIVGRRRSSVFCSHLCNREWFKVNKRIKQTTKSCGICNEVFIPKKKSVLFCSKKCSLTAEDKRKRDWYNERYQRKERLCRVCDKGFYAHNSRKVCCDGECTKVYSSLKKALKNSFRGIVRRFSLYKDDKYLELLGCTLSEFKKHIEDKFSVGMSWDNYGYYGWHYDHVKQVSYFNLSDPAEMAECFHYSNLQPLWGDENMSKSNKYIG